MARLTWAVFRRAAGSRAKFAVVPQRTVSCCGALSPRLHSTCSGSSIEGGNRHSIPTRTSLAEGLGLFFVRRRSDDLAHVVPANNSALFAAIERQVREGDTVVDAGANIGAVTVFLGKRVGAAGRVFAIEMIPETAACLCKNVALNQLHNVTLVQKALSDRADEIVHASLEAGLYGQASIATDRDGRANRSVTLLSTTLDDVLAGIEDIALLKIDLEGAECKALHGGRESIKRMHSVIFESWASDGGEAARLLLKWGFEIAHIDGRDFLAFRR